MIQHCLRWHLPSLPLDERALHYLAETAFVDLEDRHDNSGHGAHMAAMAGSWLALVQGMAGMRTDRDHLSFAPSCPDQWNGYQFAVQWQGRCIEVAVTPDCTRYRLLSGPACTLLDHGRAVAVTGEWTAIEPPLIRAVIFDLDGVLTDTAEAHYQAWQRLCDEVGIPFDPAINERLKGVDRAGSLRLILETAGIAIDKPSFAEWLDRKNAYYRDSIAHFSPDNLFPGVRALLEDCLAAGLKLGLASASRNAADLVDRLGIAELFDHIADAGAVHRGKPDPEIFLTTAAAMGVAPERCVGVEDAAAGIAAIRAAGMRAIGVGEPVHLGDAHLIVPATEQLSLSELLQHQPEKQLATTI
jgi:beta-phosphoglucomutase